MAADYSIHEIAALEDELLLPWLDLYETAFPPQERVVVSTFLGFLHERAGGGSEHRHMLCLLDKSGGLVGIAFYTDSLECPASFLWYLATVPAIRGKGAGAFFFNAILSRLAQTSQALFWDLECPALCGTEEDRSLAGRRIQFYQRLGAFLLEGIHYTVQANETLPPLTMELMLYPIAPLTPFEAFSLARRIFGDKIRQTGELALR